MNSLMHEINKYSGWEKYVDQISIITHDYDYSICAVFKIFYDKKSGAFWRRDTKKVSTSIEIEVHTFKDSLRYDDAKKLRYRNDVFQRANIWKKELEDYVNREGIANKQVMIELAEMALISSDPYVKDQFITKWLASVKPIKPD